MFFGSAFATILTPGPNMLYVGTTGAERGIAKGILAATAVVLGGVCYTVATAVGISAVMAAYPAVFTAIRIAGIAYLIYLGGKQINKARDTTPAVSGAHAGVTVFRPGLVIALTNPHLATFFLAFLPQFIVPGDGAVTLQFLKLGLTFNFCSFMVMCTVATVAGLARKANIGGVRFRQVMRVVAGLAFIFVALRSARAMLG